MERITFDILIPCDTICRIVPRTILSDIRKEFDEGCICDITTMLSEMEYITKTVREKYDMQAVFEVHDIR